MRTINIKRGCSPSASDHKPEDNECLHCGRPLPEVNLGDGAFCDVYCGYSFGLAAAKAGVRYVFPTAPQMENPNDGET